MNKNIKKIVVIGVLILMLTGLAIGGRSLLFPNTAEAADLSAISGNVQNITSSLTQSGYPDLVVQKGIPVRWNMTAEADVLNSCNQTLVIPGYGIEKRLQPGDNIIEFTPDQSGIIPYSCWMGMIDGNISVVEDITAIDQNELQNLNVLADPGKSGNGGGGCCNLRNLTN